MIYLRGPATIHESIACSLRPRKHRETFAPLLFVIPAGLWPLVPEHSWGVPSAQINPCEGEYGSGMGKGPLEC